MMIKYAVDKNGKLRYINDVATGLKCDCHCPECNAMLIAKNGGVLKEHHFAHVSGLECEHAGETVLHLLAKEVLIEKKQIITPRFNDYKEKIITFDEILTEEKFAGGRRADAVGVCKGRKLYIEFKVSHAVDEDKLNDIKKSGESCIEYDLSRLSQDITKEELAEALLNPSENNIIYQWIYAPVLEQRERDKENAKKKKWEEEERKREQQIQSIEDRYNGKVLHWEECRHCGFHTNWLEYLKHGELRPDEEGYIEHRFNKLKPKCKWRGESRCIIGDENGAQHFLCLCPYDRDSNMMVFELDNYRLLAISEDYNGSVINYKKRYPSDGEIEQYGLKTIWEGQK